MGVLVDEEGDAGLASTSLQLAYGFALVVLLDEL